MPVHELVQPTQLGDQLIARTQGQVIRIAKDDFRPRSGDHFDGETLDRSLRANGHEGRRLDDAVR